MSLEMSDMKPGAVLQSYAGSRYAYKLIEKQYHEHEGQLYPFWLYVTGQIKNNKFVPDAGPKAVAMSESKSLRESVNIVWQPEEEFNEGDILKTSDGRIVIVGGKAYSGNQRQYWYASTGRWDSRSQVESKHGALSRLTNALGDTFVGAKLKKKDS